MADYVTCRDWLYAGSHPEHSYARGIEFSIFQRFLGANAMDIDSIVYDSIDEPCLILNIKRSRGSTKEDVVSHFQEKSQTWAWELRKYRKLSSRIRAPLYIVVYTNDLQSFLVQCDDSGEHKTFNREEFVDWYSSHTGIYPDLDIINDRMDVVEKVTGYLLDQELKTGKGAKQLVRVETSKILD